ncbi:hypothetical protein, partial [Planktotalea sp.]|uniref:hypothetical protein n=1 Tax=Planktotalea sp. TaxID=2029877 RepID=UPI0035C80647
GPSLVMYAPFAAASHWMKLSDSEPGGHAAPVVGPGWMANIWRWPNRQNCSKMKLFRLFHSLSQWFLLKLRTGNTG